MLLSYSGDSLTWGYHKWGRAQHPYTDRLSQLLTEKNIAHAIDNHGVNGDSVAEMEARLINEILPAASKTPYTHAIVFGGTNDLATSEPEDIFKHIQNMAQLLSKTSQVYILNVPQPGYEDKVARPKYYDTRHKVNNLINQTFPSQLIDLDSALPRLSMSDEEQKLYFDDQLHYTAAGYTKVGEIIFEAVFSGLSKAS